MPAAPTSKAMGEVREGVLTLQGIPGGLDCP